MHIYVSVVEFVMGIFHDKRFLRESERKKKRPCSRTTEWEHVYANDNKSRACFYSYHEMFIGSGSLVWNHLLQVDCVEVSDVD